MPTFADCGAPHERLTNPGELRARHPAWCYCRARHMILTFQVRGLPAPQGSKRHVGGGRMIESSKAVGPWREAVRTETQRALTEVGSPGHAGPVAVAITFHLPRPRAHIGKRGQRPTAPLWPDRRPDLDKLVRAVLDGLTAGGAYLDDSQVVTLYAQKIYAPDGAAVGADIELESLYNYSTGQDQ